MNRRKWNCLGHLSKRNRIIVKILIGFLIVGIAVGVGLGVSKSLGYGVWQPKDH
jgi:predicted transporter